MLMYIWIWDERQRHIRTSDIGTLKVEQYIRCGVSGKRKFGFKSQGTKMIYLVLEATGMSR